MERIMDNGTLKTIVGDVTNPQFLSENEIAIIPHVCNNGGESGVGVMGAGVALALRKKWMGVYTSYKTMEVENVIGGLTNRLGDCSYSRVEDNVIVVNMIEKQ